MSDLIPCPMCQRHVWFDEVCCPFCATALTEEALRSSDAARPRAYGSSWRRAVRYALGATMAVSACEHGASTNEQGTASSASARATEPSRALDGVSTVSATAGTLVQTEPPGAPSASLSAQAPAPSTVRSARERRSAEPPRAQTRPRRGMQGGSAMDPLYGAPL